MKAITLLAAFVCTTIHLWAQPSLTFLGSNQHNQISSAKQIVNPVIQWKFQTSGSIRGSVALKEDRLFFGNADGKVFCVNKNAATKVWAFDAGSAITSTPALDNQLLYITTRAGKIFALSQAQGKVVWSFTSGSLLPHKWGWEYYLASPVVSDNAVLFGAGDGWLYSLDKKSGKELWKVQTQGRVRSTPAIFEDRVYFASFDGGVRCVELSTGKEIWKYLTEGATLNSDQFGWDRNSIDSSPAISDSLLVVGSRDGNVYCLNRISGKLKWKFSYGPTWCNASPAIANNIVYVGWSDNNLFSAIDLTSGKELWNYACGYYVYSSAKLTDGVAYVGSHDRNLYCFDQAKGTKLWQLRLPGSILSSPVIDESNLYIGTDDGAMYSITSGVTAPLIKAVYANQSTNDPRLVPYLRSFGYEPLDSAGLVSFVQKRIEDMKPSVIVLASSTLPLVFFESKSYSLRQYMEAGGRVVSTGFILNLYKTDAKGNIIGEDPALAEKLLDVKFKYTHDYGSYFSKVTELGKKAGLPDWFVASYYIEKQGDLMPLAIDEYGRFSSWIKPFKKPNSGFLQIRSYESTRSAKDTDLEYVRLVSEFLWSKIDN